MRDPTQATVTSDGLVFRLRERRVGRRALVCLVSYIVALFLVALPIPLAAERTMTVLVMELLSAPMPFFCPFSGCFASPSEAARVYFQIAGPLTIVVDQPVMIYWLLALVSPVSATRRRLLLTTSAMLVAGTIGLLVGYILVLPVAIGLLVQWNPIEIQVQWQFGEYIMTVAMLVLYVGLIFELPALLAGLVWLGAMSRPQLTRWRMYALILALVASALVTPSHGIYFQLAVAIPTYLFFELGLLLARAVPAPANPGS